MAKTKMRKWIPAVKENLEGACLTQKDVQSEKCKETRTVCTGEKKRVRSE